MPWVGAFGTFQAKPTTTEVIFSSPVVPLLVWPFRCPTTHVRALRSQKERKKESCPSCYRSRFFVPGGFAANEPETVDVDNTFSGLVAHYYAGPTSEGDAVLRLGKKKST